jgi:hypothetical protein
MINDFKTFSVEECERLMYQAPIELLITDIQHQIVKEQDEEIYRAVVHYIPNVDKEELLKALRYDRNQYEKGYADAMNSIVRCKGCKHWDEIKHGYGWGCLDKAQHKYAKEEEFCSFGERKDNG